MSWLLLASWSRRNMMVAVTELASKKSTNKKNTKKEESETFFQPPEITWVPLLPIIPLDLPVIEYDSF